MAVGVLAVFTTAFAFILYFNIIASAGATNASLVTLLLLRDHAGHGLSWVSGLSLMNSPDWP